MSVGINLVPRACLAARRRAVRRNGWIVGISVLGAVCGGLWFVRLSAERGATGASERAAYLDARMADVERQLVLALKARNDLLDSARQVADMRQVEWAVDAVADVYRAVSEPIVLTEIRGTAVPVQPPSPPAMVLATPASKPAAPPPEPLRFDRDLAVSGMAADYETVAALLGDLKRTNRWQTVELVRSKSEAYGEAAMVAFRVECRRREGRP
jgi:hypothetical protein